MAHGQVHCLWELIIIIMKDGPLSHNTFTEIIVPVEVKDKYFLED